MAEAARDGARVLPPLAIGLFVSMIRLVTALAVLVLGPSVAMTQQAEVPAINVYIEVCMGGSAEARAPVLLRGAPLELAVSLGNSRALAREEQRIQELNEARVHGPREGRVVVIPSDAPTGGDDLRLPVEGAGWIDFLTVALERLDSDGTARVVIDAPQFQAAFLADWPPPTRERVLTGRSPLVAHGELPIGLVLGLSDGRYQVKVSFDTTASTDRYAWKGRVEAMLGPLELRNPATPREECGVAYRNLGWSITHHESAAVRQCFVETMLAADESYLNFQAWALLGNLREEQGDMDGARGAWQKYVAKAAYHPEVDDDQTGYHVRQKLGLAPR